MRASPSNYVKPDLAAPMSCAVEFILPDDAERLMQKNTRNRGTRPAQLKRIARALTTDRFVPNGSAICVSKAGVLLDGQHRLQACIDTGVGFWTVIVTGLPDEAQDTIDTQKVRTVGDQLGLSGYANAAALAAAARLVFGYVDGDGIKSQADTLRTKALLERHPDLHDAVVLGLRSKAVVAPSPFAAVLFLASRSERHRSLVEVFAAQVASGEGLVHGDPALALRTALIKAKVRKGADPKTDYLMTVCTHAWNAFASGRTLMLVKAAPNAKGRYLQPDIIGAPAFGSGEEQLGLD